MELSHLFWVNPGVAMTSTTTAHCLFLQFFPFTYISLFVTVFSENKNKTNIKYALLLPFSEVNNILIMNIY